jgi:hypothetical protein
MLKTAGFQPWCVVAADHRYNIVMKILTVLSKITLGM